MISQERDHGVVGDSLFLIRVDRIVSGFWDSIVRQKNYHLGHVVGRRMGMAYFPIQDRVFIAADDFRHVLLQQSQIQSTLENCIADRVYCFRICLVLWLFPRLAAHDKRATQPQGYCPSEHILE